MKLKGMTLAALLLGLVWFGNVKAEDQNPPKPEDGKAGQHGGQAGQPGQAGGRGHGNWGGGGGPGGTGGWGGGFGFGGGGGGGNLAANLASRMFGIDIPDPKATAPKLDTLPLGLDKRMVLNVPVGGVDNPAMVGSGWKMESVFKMTDEQTKSVEALRDEYKAEQKKLDDEILAQQKATADKVKELRQKFEKRANDVLTGADKDAKEKMDKLLHDAAEKTQKDVADMLPLYDTTDVQQSFALIRAISEKKNKTTQDTESKLLELVPADNKEKIQQAMKDQDAAREQMSGWINGRGTGGRHGGPPQPQPAKPPETPPGNF